MAHPLRGDVAGNLQRARRWLKWLTDSREESMAFTAPWILEAELWDDSKPEERAAGLERCKAQVERCDEMWLCGGRVSDGMEVERRHAMRHGLTVVDITAMGKVPPDEDYCVCGLVTGHHEGCNSPGSHAARERYHEARESRSAVELATDHRVLGALTFDIQHQYFSPEYIAATSKAARVRAESEEAVRPRALVIPFGMISDEPVSLWCRVVGCQLQNGHPGDCNNQPAGIQEPGRVVCCMCRRGLFGAEAHSVNGRWYCPEHSVGTHGQA